MGKPLNKESQDKQQKEKSRGSEKKVTKNMKCGGMVKKGKKNG